MKGHMEDGKFHPHTPYKKGVRKSRDQKTKTQGVIRKARVPRNFRIPNPEFAGLITTGARYDSLTEEERQSMIRDFGLGGADSIIRTQSIPFSMLNKANKILLRAYLGGIQDADVGSIGYEPKQLRNHLGFDAEVQRLKSGDLSNLMGDIMDIERIIKENIGWTFRGTSETPEVNRAFLDSLESLGLPSSIITEKLLRDLDEANSASLSIALGQIYNKQIHQPETVHARGLDV